MKRLIKTFVQFGLSEDEISRLTIVEAKSYLRFHYFHTNDIASVVFIDFSDRDKEDLLRIARINDFVVFKRITPNVTFVCLNSLKNGRAIERARIFGNRIIDRHDFVMIFGGGVGGEYLLNTNVFIESSVPEEYRIVKPLSNFKDTFEVDSFSNLGDKAYSVNLYTMTCSCAEFTTQVRVGYLRGDIRRMCKHLMLGYNKRFGLHGLSEINSFLIGNALPIKRNFVRFFVEEVNEAIIVNYNDVDEWWDVYVKDKRNRLRAYLYVPYENSFAYGEKPIGVVPAVKKKLKQHYKELITQPGRKKNLKKVENAQGCVSMIVVFLLLTLLLFFVV